MFQVFQCLDSPTVPWTFAVIMTMAILAVWLPKMLWGFNRPEIAQREWAGDSDLALDSKPSRRFNSARRGRRFAPG
jgi:hypothetical protein